MTNKYCLIRSTFFFIGILVLLTQCTPTKTIVKYAGYNDVEHLNSGVFVQKTCNDIEGYIPDTLCPQELPIRNVRCVVHFMNSEDEMHNFKEIKARDFSSQLIKECNKKWNENPQMFLPKGNNTAALPKRIHLVLEKNLLFEGDNGVYYHKDDDLYYFVHKGRHRNSGSREVIKKYAVKPDSILNIFILAHQPDSIISPTYNAWSQGITLGKHIKVAGQWAKKKSAWQFVKLTNHEIGHVFGLSHSWAYSDGCDDTPKNPNCWNYTESGPCKEKVSNNMMDYNAYQNALSPCQIARMHKNFGRLKSRQRAILVEDWCVLDSTTKDIHISSNRVWTGAKDLKNNVVVEAGAVLKISCRISMPEYSSITVQPGGLLILEKATLHNSCGKFWNGIQIEYLGDIKGRVVMLEDSKIEDVFHPIVKD